MSQAEWLELESDPGLFTLLLEDFGVQGVQVEEIYDLSKPITEIVYGFIFLFHWNKAKKKPCRRTGRGSTGSVANTISPSSYTSVPSCDNNVRTNAVTQRTGNNSFRHRSVSGSGQEILGSPEVKSVDGASECKAFVSQSSDKIEIFFAHQVVQNSCATHALLSILLNRPEINIGHMLAEFQKATRHLSPEAKGLAIGSMPQLAQAHNRHAAKPPAVFKDETPPDVTLPEPSQAAATAAAIAKASMGASNSMNSSDSSPGLTATATSGVTIPDTFHFVCYVPIGGFLYELDGLTSEPINHGPLKNPNDQFAWTKQCADVLKERMQEQDVRYNLLAVVPDRRVALTKRMQMLKRNRQLIQNILIRMCNYDPSPKLSHCSSNTTTTVTVTSHNHSHRLNGHHHPHSDHIQDHYGSNHSEHCNNHVCVPPTSSSSSVSVEQHEFPCQEKCSSIKTNVHTCDNNRCFDSIANNADKNKHESLDDLEDSHFIKTRSATRAAKQTTYESNHYDLESIKTTYQKQNSTSISDGIHSTSEDYNNCCSNRKRSSYSSNDRYDLDYWKCEHKKPHLLISHDGIINNQNGYKSKSDSNYSPDSNKMNRIFASFISDNSPLSLTAFTTAAFDTVNKLDTSKPSHVTEDFKDSNGSLQDSRYSENTQSNGITTKVEENCTLDGNNCNSCEQHSDFITKVTSSLTCYSEINSKVRGTPFSNRSATFLSKQGTPPKELTKPLTIETKLWCDSAENVSTGESATSANNEMYLTGSSVTSSTEMGGMVSDSRPQTRALTRASLKQNLHISAPIPIEERTSNTKMTLENVQSMKSDQMHHDSSINSSSVCDLHILPKLSLSTENSPTTPTFSAESNISTVSTVVTGSHRGSKYPTRSSTRMDTLASHNLANLRSNPVTVQSNISPSKVNRTTSFEQNTITAAANNNIATTTTPVVVNTSSNTDLSKYMSPFTYSCTKLKNSPSLYPPLSVEELNILLHKIDEQIKICIHALIEEEEKRRSYRIDDARRVHNYEPFIRAFLTALARHGMLKNQILSAMQLKNSSSSNQNHNLSIQVSDSCKKSNIKKSMNDKHIISKSHAGRIYSFSNTGSIKNRTFRSNSLVNRLTRVNSSTNNINKIRVSHHYSSLNYRKLRTRNRKNHIKNLDSNCAVKCTVSGDSQASLIQVSNNNNPSYNESSATIISTDNSLSCNARSKEIGSINSPVTRQTSTISTQNRNSCAVRSGVDQQHDDETGGSVSEDAFVNSNGNLCTINCQKSAVVVDENIIVEGNLLISTVSSVTVASCSSCGSSPQSSNSSRSTNLRSGSCGVKLRQANSDIINNKRSLRPRTSRERVSTRVTHHSTDSVSVTSEEPETSNVGINLRGRTPKSSSRINVTDYTKSTVIDSSTSSNPQRFRKRRLH